MDDMQLDQRISLSREALRAELGALELRLVDRLNGALESKADKVVQEQHSRELADLSTRMTTLDQQVVRKAGPEIQKIEVNSKRLDELSSISKYKRWLWVQTAALIGIAVPLVGILFDHWVSP